MRLQCFRWFWMLVVCMGFYVCIRFHGRKLPRLTGWQRTSQVDQGFFQLFLADLPISISVQLAHVNLTGCKDWAVVDSDFNGNPLLQAAQFPACESSGLDSWNDWVLLRIWLGLFESTSPGNSWEKHNDIRGWKIFEQSEGSNLMNPLEPVALQLYFGALTLQRNGMILSSSWSSMADLKHLSAQWLTDVFRDLQHSPGYSSTSRPFELVSTLGQNKLAGCPHLAVDPSSNPWSSFRSTSILFSR